MRDYSILCVHLYKGSSMFQKHCKLVFICATNKLSSYQHTLSFAMRNKVSHGPITITKAFSSIEFGLQGQPDGFYHYIKTISNFFFFLFRMSCWDPKILMVFVIFLFSSFGYNRFINSVTVGKSGAMVSLRD